jgi:hypothetical protein
LAEDFLMDWRDPAYNSVGTVDVEINHPVHGWIPFTASPDDSAGKDIYDAVIAAGNIAPYVAPDPVVPDRVTARQFKLQLLAAGLLDQVEAWIDQQDKAVQIAYANSGTFLRTEPMMQTGFAALGFTSEQIDAFYVAAAAL